MLRLATSRSGSYPKRKESERSELHRRSREVTNREKKVKGLLESLLYAVLFLFVCLLLFLFAKAFMLRFSRAVARFFVTGGGGGGGIIAIPEGKILVGDLRVSSPRKFSNLQALKRLFSALVMRCVSEKSTSNIKMANNYKSLKITESKENKSINRLDFFWLNRSGGGGQLSPCLPPACYGSV